MDTLEEVLGIRSEELTDTVIRSVSSYGRNEVFDEAEVARGLIMRKRL